MAYLRNKYGLSPRDVAARIKAERERIGLTQEEAARKLGVGRTSYSQLEVTANPQASKLVGLVRIGFDLRAILPELFEPTGVASIIR